jgi:hypothetical protein
MIVLSFLVNVIASLLGNVLVGVSTAVLHTLAVFSLLAAAGGLAIVSPGLFLLVVVVLAALYFSGSIR